MTSLILLAVVCSLAISIGIFMYVLRFKTIIAEHMPLMSAQIQNSLVETNSRNKDAVVEGLVKNFEVFRQSLEGQISKNRQEIQDTLALSRKELDVKFTMLENKVNERLDVIGKNVQTKLDVNIQEGFKHFQLVVEGLTNAEKQLANLNLIGNSVTELNNLLKLPHLRGGFGESSLERLLNDFLPAGSFSLQYEISPGGLERVDAVVHFPNVKLPIDSKFPREQVLPLFEGANATDPSALLEARKVLAETIKAQAKSIATKYIKPEHGTTEIALMFLPSETLYFEIVRDSALWESLAKLQVFPVSPNTLAISLQFIGRSMHYYEAAQNVKKLVQDLAKSRKHFENFQKKFEDIGKGLEKAQDAFSTATRHLGTYRGSVNRLAGDVGEPEELPPSDLAQ